jgi:transcription termination factor NusB
LTTEYRSDSYIGKNIGKEQPMQQILEIQDKMEKRMNAGKEQMMADRIADREYMKQMMGRTDDNQERMDTDLKKMREEI